jgi:hypothetical protein
LFAGHFVAPTIHQRLIVQNLYLIIKKKVFPWFGMFDPSSVVLVHQEFPLSARR